MRCAVCGVAGDGVEESPRSAFAVPDLQRLPVATPQLARTLEQAAVHEHRGLRGADVELAAGHSADAAQEGQGSGGAGDGSWRSPRLRAWLPGATAPSSVGERSARQRRKAWSGGDFRPGGNGAVRCRAWCHGGHGHRSRTRSPPGPGVPGGRRGRADRDRPDRALLAQGPRPGHQRRRWDPDPGRVRLGDGGRNVGPRRVRDRGQSGRWETGSTASGAPLTNMLQSVVWLCSTTDINRRLESKWKRPAGPRPGALEAPRNAVPRLASTRPRRC